MTLFAAIELAQGKIILPSACDNIGRKRGSS